MFEPTEDRNSDDLELDDHELTRLALAADPEMVMPDDAVPISVLLDADGAAVALLPAWYMGGTVRYATRGRRWKRVVVMAVVVAFLMIDAYGLCSTYGSVTIG